MLIDYLEYADRRHSIRMRGLIGARYLGLRHRDDGAALLGVRAPWSIKNRWIEILDLTEVEVDGKQFHPDFSAAGAADPWLGLRAFLEQTSAAQPPSEASLATGFTGP